MFVAIARFPEVPTEREAEFRALLPIALTGLVNLWAAPLHVERSSLRGTRASCALATGFGCMAARLVRFDEGLQSGVAGRVQLQLHSPC